MEVIVGLLLIIGIIWLIDKPWVCIVALGVGLMMAAVVQSCVLIAWAIAVATIGRKKPCDCGDSPCGWGVFPTFVGQVSGIWSHPVIEKDYFFSFLHQVAIWCGVVRVVLLIFDRMCDSDPPRPTPSPSRPLGTRAVEMFRDRRTSTIKRP